MPPVHAVEAPIAIAPLPTVAAASHGLGPFLSSFGFHALLAGCGLWLGGVNQTALFDVETGRASIALEASFAASELASRSEAPEVAAPVVHLSRGRVELALLPVERPAVPEVALATHVAPALPVLRVASEPRSVAPSHQPPAPKQIGPAALPAESARASLASESSRGVREERLPEIVLNTPPEYPPAALAAGTTGRVMVLVVVDPQGAVVSSSLHRTSGTPSLDASALAAVRQWRFSPSTNLAAPERRVIVPIDFVIR